MNWLNRGDAGGFIQIPIIFMIIAGIAVLGGAGYGVSKIMSSSDSPQDENSRIEELERQIADLQQYVASSSEQGAEEGIADQTDELRQEIDALKKQNTYTPSVIPTQTVSIPTQTQSVGLSNIEIISKVKPAVVYIKTKYGSGTGVIIPGGMILTNAHVMAGVYTATITRSDGGEFESRILGRDGLVDVALLALPEQMKYYPLTAILGDSDRVSVGDRVFTLGYPFGLTGSVSFKEGTFSRQLTLDGKQYLETSAEIHAGNSGGPLVNAFGEVVGINTAVFGNSIAGIQLGETIKLAIPINKIKSLIPLLKAGRVVSGSKWIPLPTINCGNNNYVTVRGECSCIQGYIDVGDNMCRPGLSYCQVNYGHQYAFDEPTNSCTCAPGYELEGEKCAPIE